jgi:membrane fusion protein
VAAVIKVDQPVYKVDISLDAQHIVKDGERLPLKSGMTLTATFVLERRSLLSRLLEPLASVRGRN